MELTAGWAVVWACTSIFCFGCGIFLAMACESLSSQTSSAFKNAATVLGVIEIFASIIVFLALIVTLTS